MVRETYTSEFLDKLSREIKEKFGVSIWFAEILGRRWSYIAGEKEEDDTFMPPERIQLSDRLGAVIECGDLPKDKLNEIVSFLKKKVKEL